MQTKTRKMLSKTTSSGETAFPWKLHMVLEESTFEGFDDIISWIGNNAFKVHDPIQFEESVMQRFFNQTQYKSFQRQLNIYGFTRVKTAGKATGSYTHPLFIRGNPDACAFMVRVKVKKKGIRKNLTRSLSNKHNRSDSVGSQEDLVKSTSYPLHKRFVSISNDSARAKGLIEPTPLRSVSPSSTNMKNDVFEPTPLRINSMGLNNRVVAMGVVPNHNVVPCDRGCYMNNQSIHVCPQQLDDSGRSMGSSIDSGKRIEMFPSMQQPQQRRFAKRCLSQLTNVELDLDTIFDDDTTAKYYNSTNYAANGNAADLSLFNSYAMDNACFNRNFHAVDEPLPSAVASQMVGIN